MNVFHQSGDPDTSQYLGESRIERAPSKTGIVVRDIDLKSMPLDELWALHETICSVLARKLEAQKRSDEQRLNELRRTIGRASNETPLRRPYPKVHPKFRNPEPPHETWSGRGMQPRWVTGMIDAGKSLDDLRIPDSAARRSRGRHR
jgi:DNA-binding protein H-NS